MKKRYRIILVLIVVFSLMLTINVIGEADQGKEERVYYEIFVRSFHDSNEDGVGDLQGITEKLDYLDKLGVKGIWLMPITASNSYHGYDVADYYKVNSDYGNLEDLRELTKKAHEHGMKVIMDLVINHTSKSHPWFQKARESKDSKYRDYYIWAKTPPETKQTSPYGGSVWHNSLNGYYYALFVGSMPDLNYNNPKVQKEVIRVGKFWLKQGIDGFRLDAAKHIFRPEDHDRNVKWWKKFRQEMKEVDSDVYIVGEVWDEPKVVAKYLECFDSGFNFTAGENILNAVKMEQNLGLTKELTSIYDYYQNNVKSSYIDAPFLANHDQNRVMSQLKWDKKKAKLAANIYLTLPGNPFVYYGEEIGMKGTKPDQRIREPFKWYGDQKKGETSWTFAISNMDVTPAVKQMEQSDSMLKHYQRVIGFRNDNPVLSTGDIEFIGAGDKVIGYQRFNQSRKLDIYHNLSGKSQAVKVDKGEVIFVSPDKRVKTNMEKEKMIIAIPPYTSIVIE